jgi:NH3-dependent NAD+ synthetase
LLASELDLSSAKRRIASFIKKKVEESMTDGAVLGISGGIDSAVTAYLCVEALGSRRVTGLIMPDLRATPDEDVKDARLVASELCIETKEIDVAPIHKSYMKSLEPNRLAEGNLRARIRMSLLYYHANLMNRLVVGTGDRSELLLGYFCYDSQTRVMTPEGPKYYWELEQGSPVLSMDLRTRKVVEVPVGSVNTFDYDGEMVAVKSRHLNLLVTPNHRMLISRNHGRGPLGFSRADSLFAASAVDIPIPEPWDGIDAMSETLETAKFLKSPLGRNAHMPLTMEVADFLYLMGLFIGDGTSSEGEVTATVKSEFTHDDYVPQRNGMGQFVGMTNPSEHLKTYSVQRIFIASTEGKRSRQPLLHLLDKYSVNRTETPTVVAFTNRALSDAFDECGHGAGNKVIPKWVLRLPARQLTSLYKGLVQSDGNADGQAYSTTSKVLAFQMVELCAKVGMAARIKWRGPKTSVHAGKEIKSKGYYDVRISQRIRNIGLVRSNFSRVRYKGKVWCPTVPPFENMLVERNGTFTFCGNTKYGDGGVDILPIADLYKTEVRRLGDGLGINRRIVAKRSSPRLWPGHIAESEIGMSYEVIDRLFKLRFEEGLEVDAIAVKMKQSQAKVEGILAKYQASEHKRKMPEICKLRS